MSKISIYNEQPCFLTFENLKGGDIFSQFPWNNKLIFMKLNVRYGIFTAVNLSTGQLHWITDDTRVHKYVDKINLNMSAFKDINENFSNEDSVKDEDDIKGIEGCELTIEEAIRIRDMYDEYIEKEKAKE